MRTLVLIGAVSLLGQVVLLRELNVACFGSELIYLLAMGLWLLGSAFGTVLGRRDERPAPRRVAVLLIAAAMVLPASLVVARGARVWLGGVPGAYLSFDRQLVTMAIVTLPYAALCGLLFRRAALVVMARGRSLAAAYAADCGGALIGGALATTLLAMGVSNLAACLLCGLAAAIEIARLMRLVGFATAAVLLGGIVVSAPLDRALTRWNHPDLLATRDTPYGRLTSAGREGQVALFVNDALAHENQGTSAEEFVHLAALQCASPDRILVLGGGWEDLPVEAARYEPAHLTHVELNRALLELKGAATNAIIADPRRYLRRPGTYDLILAGTPEPESGLDNRYYTREFFQACRARLAADGVLAFRLRGAENLWTPALTVRNAGVYRALADIFAHVVVLPGGTNVFIASQSALPTVTEVADRLAARGFDLRLVSPAYVRYLYQNDRFTEVNTRLAASSAPANTDARPACFRHTLVLWLARFFPHLGWVEQPASAAAWRQPWVWIAAAAWLLIACFVRGRSTAGRSLAVGAAAAAGMILEMALILHYQVRVGALYQDLGLLLMLFMLGLTLGAASMAHLRPAGGFVIAPWIGLVATAGATAVLIDQTWSGSLFVVGGLLIVSGAAVAAIFAQLSHDNRPQHLVAPLYASDLLGGGLGSLAAGLYFIPVWGLMGSALAAATLALLATAPLVIGRR